MTQWVSPLEYFVDPIMRGPTLACMLMCFSASLLGVIIYLRKQSLVGEVLSHACYPGIMLSVVLVNAFFPLLSDDGVEFTSIFGAFVSSLLALGLILLLQRRFSLKEDTALTFVLSSFFGLGILLASRLQFTSTSLYKKAQASLFGQAATMTDTHIYIYAFLALFTLSLVVLFFKEIQAVYFDEGFSRLIGIRASILNAFVFFLILLIVVVGIRCVGVLLMSAMFIAPVVAARQLTHRLSLFFVLSALFGALSGFLGNYLSLELSREFSSRFSHSLSIATGPMVVLVSSLLALVVIIVSPKQGIIARAYRVLSFRYRCVLENTVKTLLYLEQDSRKVNFSLLSKYQGVSKLFLFFTVYRLKLIGHIRQTGEHLALTNKGKKRALKILRLHRLWEVYLVQKLGIGQKRVHHNAEMIEHILTPELEKALTFLLNDPKVDPHLSPIPTLEETQ